MNRRQFIGAFASALATVPLSAGAQSRPEIARIGLLMSSNLENPATQQIVGVVRQGLADLGYVDGRNIVLERRGANTTADQLDVLAAELVGLKVDVIIAIATPAARAAQRATTTIPIVMGSVGEPVQDGFVASLSHPGGNVTGTTFLGPELVPKQLAILKELLTAASQVAVLWNPNAFSKQTTADMMEKAADAANVLGLRLHYIEVPGPDDFERAVSDAGKWHADAMFHFPNPTFFNNRKRLVDLAAKYRLPAMYNAREFAEVGGLIGYGASPVGMNRRTAFYVDKILKGAKPADLPVEQPTNFELAINRTTATMLG